MKATTVHFAILASVLLLSAALLGAIVPNTDNIGITNEQYIKTVDFDTPTPHFESSSFDRFTDYELITNDEGTLTFTGSAPLNSAYLSTEQMKNEKNKEANTNNSNKDRAIVKMKESPNRTNAEGTVDVYEEGEFLETVPFKAWSAPDDVLFSIDGVTYSSKEILSKEGVEDCIFPFILIAVGIILSATLVDVVVALVVVGFFAYLTYEGVKYYIEQKEKYNDGSEKTVFKIEVNQANYTANVNGTTYNLKNVQNSNAQKGKYYFAAIFDDGIVYMSTIEIPYDTAKKIMKIEMTADLIGVYTPLQNHALQLVVDANNDPWGYGVIDKSNIRGPENHIDSPRAVKGAYYYDHYHTREKSHIHSFYGVGTQKK